MSVVTCVEDKGDTSTTWSRLLEDPIPKIRSKWSRTCHAKATLKVVFRRVCLIIKEYTRSKLLCIDMLYVLYMLYCQNTRGFEGQTLLRYIRTANKKHKKIKMFTSQSHSSILWTFVQWDDIDDALLQTPPFQFWSSFAESLPLHLLTRPPASPTTHVFQLSKPSESSEHEARLGDLHIQHPHLLEPTDHHMPLHLQ